MKLSSSPARGNGERWERRGAAEIFRTSLGTRGSDRDSEFDNYRRRLAIRSAVTTYRWRLASGARVTGGGAGCVTRGGREGGRVENSSVGVWGGEGGTDAKSKDSTGI